MNNQPSIQQPMQKNPIWKKILIIIGGFVVLMVIIGIVIFAIVSATSKKLECTSSKGSITIMYNDDTVTGYTAANVNYDIDSQKNYASKVGIDKYLDEFTKFFESEAEDGVCTRK